MFGGELLRFKKHFLIFSAAWIVTAAVVSDTLLLSSFRSLSLNTDDGSPLPAMLLVPAAFAAAVFFIISPFCRLIVRRLRRKLVSLGGCLEYPFFRSFCTALAAAAAANTVLLCSRFLALLEILKKEEERRIHMLFFDQPDYLASRLDALSQRASFCGSAAVVITLLLAAAKAAAYLFLARALVRTYHKNAATAYTNSISAV